jgi:hypothetical protein
LTGLERKGEATAGVNRTTGIVKALDIRVAVGWPAKSG